MMEAARGWVGTKVARFRFRKQRDAVISFPYSLGNARAALLVMPYTDAEANAAAPIVDLLKEQIGDDHITLVLRGSSDLALRKLPRAHVLRVVDQEISPFFLPRPELVERIRRRGCDLAIDLNLAFQLSAAYICKASGARVRIGFTAKQADMFYNLQIQPNPSLNRQQVYDRLVLRLRKIAAGEWS
jgi:ADP-heptose:LPS heptosyltransferase